ncbi:uncharacterized protein LOC127153433 [Labeo rohita]|uniref:uncharacterized protein LOC127153433 n=1 Tax=Labeo rohita TaxID=84645 RepID=UPI0021E2DB0C|nr:uncharacterized protein LOC127153433 [Labeo rohita]
MFGLFVFCCLSCLIVFADTDAVMSVPAMKGDPVTLESGITEIQTDDLITWKFGHSETLIATINKISGSFSTSPGDAVGFRDRLKLDHKTGSLTITNTTSSDSGLYQLSIRSKRKTTYRFNVTVYDRLPVPAINRNSPQDPSSSQQNCSLLCSVVNVSHMTLSWYKGKSLWSSISASDLNNRLSLPLEIKCLVDSYSCVLNDSFFNQTTHLNNDLCQSCPVTASSTESPPQSSSQSPLKSSSQTLSQSTPSHHSDSVSVVVPISAAAAVAGSLLTVAAVGMIWTCRKHKKTDQEER